jgi:Lrp/AsnC family leucine-responsive transcriptional regulator
MILFKQMNMMGDFDETDLAILRELSLNGRESLTRLAEKLRLSKQRLGYRLRGLQRRGALTGFFAIPNIFRLGFDHFRVFVRFQRLTEAREKELLDHLLTRSDVSWLTQLDGDFDLEFVVWAQRVPDFESAYDDILGQFGSLFQEKYFSLATRIEFLPWRFLTPDTGGGEPGVILESRGGPLGIDASDRRLLAELSRNGRLSLAALARRCRISPALAAVRLRGLRKSGAIAGFGAKIDHALLGRTYRKVFLRLERPAGAALDGLSAWLRSRPEVIFLVKTIGSWDLEVELMTGPGDEFLVFMRRLRTAFAADIAAFRSVIVLRELKYGQYPA